MELDDQLQAGRVEVLLDAAVKATNDTIGDEGPTSAADMGQPY